MFGSCGSLQKEVTDGKFIIPTQAYRGDGLSYYFAKPQDYIEIKNADKLVEIGLRNPTGFRRWVKVAGSGGLCYTRVMGTWKSKTDTNICYSIILFSYASIERNC